MPSFSMDNIVSIIPEIIIMSAAMAALVLEVLMPKEKRVRYIAYFSLAAILLAAYETWGLRGLNLDTFSGMFVLDGYAIFFKMLFYLATGLSVLISMGYMRDEKVEKGEYYGLLLFAASGMMVMASGSDLITVYLGIELMALSVYVLAGFLRRDMKSNEAALKYFLLGAFSSGILLYGIAIMFGITGSTNLREIAAFLHTGNYSRPALVVSMVLIAAGFSFKVAAAPFHMWAPDVYEGAPTSVTAFMSVGPKAAAFAAFLRVFMVALPELQPDWTMVLSVLAILSMLVGNVVAIAQTNIKRMLAYSSIAHAGYALVGFVTGGGPGASSVMLYLFIYTLMNVGAFGIVIMLRKRGLPGDNIEDFAGLAKKNRMAALLMLIFMFSLAGIPPTAGFIGKFYIFMGALDAGFLWLAAITVVMSVVSAFFYLRVVMVMYMRDPSEDMELSLSNAMRIVMAATAYGVLYIGMNPYGILKFAVDSVAGII